MPITLSNGDPLVTNLLYMVVMKVVVAKAVSDQPTDRPKDLQCSYFVTTANINENNNNNNNSKRD